MSKIRRAAVLGALATTLSAGILAGTSAPAAAGEKWDSCDLSVKVKELQSLDANDEHNIIVWKESAYESAHFEGVKVNEGTSEKECSKLPSTVTYHWVVFKSGEFTRKGDGGYRNWAFAGNFERTSDTHVVFNER